MAAERAGSSRPEARWFAPNFDLLPWLEGRVGESPPVFMLKSKLYFAEIAMQKNTGRVKRFGLNKLGRDFVVGDIHGAYAMARQALAEVRFNPRVDRLFSVGDLIDRGPDSIRAIDFLSQAHVSAIRGNHDHDFAGLSNENIRALAMANWNGLGWALNVSDAKLDELRKKIDSLPFAMEIETARGRVGLVHGDVPRGMDWGIFTQALEEGDESVMQEALWGRARLETMDDSGVRGIDRMFVGHTIQWTGPKRLGNVYAIDTGAVFHELGMGQGAMTMANLMCQSQAVDVRRADGQVDPVWTLDGRGLGPFGQYVN